MSFVEREKAKKAARTRAYVPPVSSEQIEAAARRANEEKQRRLDEERQRSEDLKQLARENLEESGVAAIIRELAEAYVIKEPREHTASPLGSGSKNPGYLTISFDHLGYSSRGWGFSHTFVRNRITPIVGLALETISRGAYRDPNEVIKPININSIFIEVARYDFSISRNLVVLVESSPTGELAFHGRRSTKLNDWRTMSTNDIEFDFEQVYNDPIVVESTFIRETHPRGQ